MPLSILSDDVYLDIRAYYLVRADLPASTKRGGACIYFRKSVPLTISDIHFLDECINFEMRLGDKVCNYISIYRLPNQSREEYEALADYLEPNLETIAKINTFLIVPLSDLKTKLSTWYENDITSYESTKIDGITSQFGIQ